jgi:hypothetical protein
MNISQEADLSKAHWNERNPHSDKNDQMGLYGKSVSIFYTVILFVNGNIHRGVLHSFERCRHPNVQ